MAEDKWNVKGLRGSVLEELINYTNEKYRQQKLALVQKIPTSIKPVRFDKTKRHITLAYFDQKSTVDYIGVVQGIPICFDAKECAKDIFPLQNIHEHQVEFMRQYEEQGGISFLLIYFTSRHVCYYMSFQEMKQRFGLKDQLLHCTEVVFPRDMKTCRNLSGKKIQAPLPKRFDMIKNDLFGRVGRA